MTTALLDSEIVCDRITRDYAILIAGVPCGFGRTYHEAEGIRTQLLAERRDEGHYATASELGSDDTPDGDDCPDHGPYADDGCPKCCHADPDEQPEPWPDTPVACVNWNS